PLPGRGPALAAITAGLGVRAGARRTGLVPRQATFVRQGAASWGSPRSSEAESGGACSRRAGRKSSYWTYVGFRPVRREGVPGVATGRTLPGVALVPCRVPARVLPRRRRGLRVQRVARGQQVGQQVPSRRHRAELEGDGDVVVGPVHDHDGIAGPYLTRL